MFFLWRLQCTKKLRNSPLCPGEWSSITNGSFLRFFLFSLPFRNSIMPNNRSFKTLNNLSFWTKFYVSFVKIAMYQKIAKFSTLSTGVKLNRKTEVFFDFFSFHYHLGTVSWQNNSFSKNSIIWFFQRNFMFFLWRLQCTKKLRNSPLCPREWSWITNRSFLRFFLFSLPFRNSIMPNNIFSKNSINVSFSTKFYGFFLWRLQCTKKLRNSPLCPREWSSITNRSFLRLFLFSLPFRNSTMPNNRFSKNSIIWVFQRNFMFFFVKIAMYQKIAKFSTLSTGVKLNRKSKFSSIFSLFITI